MRGLTLFMGRCWVVLRVLMLLSFCSCQAALRTCEEVEPFAPERESGATFVVRRTGPEIRLQSGGGLMVGGDGAVHLFSSSGVRGGSVVHWKYEDGAWASLGSVTDRAPRARASVVRMYDAVQTPDGRPYLFVGDEVLSPVGGRWEVVHTLKNFYYPIAAKVRAVVGPDGVVHVLYSGDLGERYMHMPDNSTVTKIFHAALSEGRWTQGKSTAARGRYEPRYFRPAAGPEGSLYAAFRVGRVPPFLPSRGWKYHPLDLALSVFRDGKWQEPVILVEAPDEASGIPARPFGRVRASGIPARPFGRVRAPGIVVDRAGTCHVVLNNNYLQYRNGNCTRPWPFSSHAYGSTIFLDRQQRLIIFFLKEEGLLARIRDHRGWSDTFKVIDSTEARLLQGFDGHIYLVWTEGRLRFIWTEGRRRLVWAEGGRPADLRLQRLAFEEVGAATAPAQ